MSYVIGSFNIQDFNLTKDFDKLAQIIVSEHMDVVGIQEVNSKDAVDMLVAKLNNQSRSIETEWKGSFPSYPRSHDPTGESYAFVWNDKKLSLVDIKDKENPRLIENFVIKGIPGQKDLIRNPFFAIFTAAGHIGGSNFEIRLINTHIRSGKNKTGRYAECTDTEKKMRINELNLLIKEILPFCQDLRTGKNMTAYTFLLGDYNLCLDNGIGKKYRIEEITEEDDFVKRRSYRTIQKLPTSLKKTCKGEDANEEDDDEDVQEMTENTDYYSQNFDHFTYDTQLEDRMTIIPDRVEAVDIAYGKESYDKQKRLEKYIGKISDHVPIKITVDILKRYA